jgi:NAD(P)H-flavin reductase
MDVRAGQYVTLIRECGLARSYSLASLSGECDFEIHVRRIAGGKMSSWLDEGACVGERVSVLGPSGECFYVAGKEDQPMLLVGTGTGLAPLYGILRDALRHGHRGSISLFHGAVDVSGLYLVDELLRLAGQYPQLNYTAAVLRGDESDRVAVGPVDEVVMKRFPKVSGWRAYVCGDPGLVTKLKKKLFLSGMASREIYADPFVPAAPAS